MELTVRLTCAIYLIFTRNFYTLNLQKRLVFGFVSVGSNYIEEGNFENI